MIITKYLKELLIVNGIRQRKDPFSSKFVKCFHVNSTDWITYVSRKCTISFGIMLDCNRKKYLQVDYDSINKDVLILVRETDKQTSETTHLLNVKCKMCYTEEQFFMESTLYNTAGITLEDLSLIDEIYKKYHKKVKRWK